QASRLADEAGGPHLFPGELGLARVVLDFLGGRWDTALEALRTVAADLGTRGQAPLAAPLAPVGLGVPPPGGGPRPGPPPAPPPPAGPCEPGPTSGRPPWPGPSRRPGTWTGPATCSAHRWPTRSPRRTASCCCPASSSWTCPGAPTRA